MTLVINSSSSISIIIIIIIIKWLFGNSIILLLTKGKARKDAKPGSSGSKRQLEEGNNGSAGLNQQGRGNNASAGLDQQGRGNKRCRLGPTEQLRVVVRQILAGSLTADMLCKANFACCRMYHHQIIRCKDVARGRELLDAGVDQAISPSS